MTNKERIKKVLANEPVDRVPVAFFHHSTEMPDWNTGLENPEAIERSINGHRTMLEKFVPDVIKIMNDALMLLPMDLSFVDHASDLYKIKPLKMTDEFAQKQIDLTNRVVEIYKGVDAPIYATTFSAVWILRNALLGGVPVYGADERLMHRLMDEDPEAVKYALDTITDGIIELNKILLTECGVDGLYISVKNQGNFFPEEFHRKYVAPSEKHLLEEANKIRYNHILHICGYDGHGNNLELFTDYDAAAYSIALHAEGVTIDEVRKLFPGKCIVAGFSQFGNIYKGPREDLVKETWDILDNYGQTGIILGADCTLESDIDDNRFNWVREAAIEYAARH